MSTSTLDPVFDALANGHRRKIVSLLTGGPLDTPSLGPRFEITKQALNRHLVVLEQAGLIQRERHGRVHQLVLVGEQLDQVSDWVSHVRQGWEANFNRLEHLLGVSDPRQHYSRTTPMERNDNE